MKAKHSYMWLPLLSLISCSTRSEAPEAISLQFQPQTEKHYTISFKTVTTSKEKSGMIGDTFNFRFDLIPDYVDSSKTRLRLVIQELSLGRHVTSTMMMAKPGNKFAGLLEKYSSDKKRILQNTAGDSLTLVLNNGAILLMEDGLDELIRHTSEKTGIEEAQVRQVIHQYYSPAVLRDLMTELFFYLPLKQVHTKDTWVSNTMLTALAPVKYSNMLVIDTIQHAVVYMTVKSQISAGGNANVYMDGTRTGSLESDLNSGFPLKANFIDQTVTRTTGGEINKTRVVEIRCTIKELCYFLNQGYDKIVVLSC